jgi:hypothetical protein
MPWRGEGQLGPSGGVILARVRGRSCVLWQGLAWIKMTPVARLVICSGSLGWRVKGGEELSRNPRNAMGF